MNQCIWSSFTKANIEFFVENFQNSYISRKISVLFLLFFLFLSRFFSFLQIFLNLKDGKNKFKKEREKFLEKTIRIFCNSCPYIATSNQLSEPGSFSPHLTLSTRKMHFINYTHTSHRDERPAACALADKGTGRWSVKRSRKIHSCKDFSGKSRKNPEEMRNFQLNCIYPFGKGVLLDSYGNFPAKPSFRIKVSQLQ